MYKRLIRPILFLFNPEQAHHLACWGLKLLEKIPFLHNIISSKYSVKHPSLERHLMGLKFPNPIGLAAGFDKDAKMYKELSSFGFGFIEIGTLTPKAQSGNPKKRLFRLKEDSAIINRMGFNNLGVDKAVEKLRKKGKIIVGGNIGKNKLTPNQDAFEDYKICFEKLFEYVDYFVVNISSPNTKNLRELQDKKPLENLLQKLQNLNFQREKTKPILLKIAPDLNDGQLLDIIDIVKKTQISGVIATNTTILRTNLTSENKKETGGLSGKPLKERSTEIIRFIAEESKKSFIIIGVGGISSPKDALEKIEAGADLVQIYTGLIYEGPALVKKINKALISSA